MIYSIYFSKKMPHLDLVPGDSHSLGDELFLGRVGVAHLSVDVVEQFQLVSCIAEAFSLWGWTQGGGVGHTWRDKHHGQYSIPKKLITHVMYLLVHTH